MIPAILTWGGRSTPPADSWEAEIDFHHNMMRVLSRKADRARHEAAWRKLDAEHVIRRRRWAEAAALGREALAS